MNPNPPLQEEIDAFMKSLKAWAKTLPEKQQALLKQLVIKVETISGATGPLSEAQLAEVAGGLKKDPLWVRWASQTMSPG